jgi:hypothetical protein
MDERRGLVLERLGNRVTAVTKSGEFVTWRDRRDLMPGEEVVIPSPRFQGFFWRRLIPATALAAVLVFMSFFGYRHYLYARPVMAYVTFDCAGEYAGSIELEVNDRGLVKSASALNEAGSQALSKVQCEMKPVGQVLASLRESVPEKEEVVVAFIPAVQTAKESDKIETGTGSDKEPGEKGNNKKPKDHKEEKTQKKVAELEKQVLNAIERATKLILDSETRKEAQELGISAGRAASWALWRAGKESRPETQKPGPFSGSGTVEVLEPAGPVGDPDTQKDPEPGKPEKPGSSGRAPGKSDAPGQQKKEDRDAWLEKVRGSLPRLDLDSLGEFDSSDSKDFGNRVLDVTKDWLKSLKDKSEEYTPSNKESKDAPSGRKESPAGENGKGQGEKDKGEKPGKGNSKPEDDREPDGKDRSNPGKSNDKPGKDNTKPGKDNSRPEKSDSKPGKDDSGAVKTGSWGSSQSGVREPEKGSSLSERLKWTSEFWKQLWK